MSYLQLLQEEMQTNLEVMEVIEEELLQQNEYLATERQRYYDLFQFTLDAYLVTNAQGVILEANRTAAALFNLLPNSLIGKPLAIFVPPSERSAFRTKLNQLSSVNSLQEWEIPMCPRQGKAFDALLLVTPIRAPVSEFLLKWSVRNITKYKQTIAQQIQSAPLQLLPEAAAVKLPLSLDGLQVLIVDDEADAREFITTVLSAQGIGVTAVSTAAEALAALERFRPDVLMSDIRMPDESGYSLIRKVRELEAEKGWHIPAAALSAYLAEDREKALKAGFESHLHKLAPPEELVEMVTRLARLSCRLSD